MHAACTASFHPEVQAFTGLESLPQAACRWDWDMASPGVTDQEWRKSSQWSSLVRSHAQLVADDMDLDRAFQQSCYTYLPDVALKLPDHVQAGPAPVPSHCGCCGRSQRFTAMRSLQGSQVLSWL